MSRLWEGQNFLLTSFSSSDCERQVLFWWECELWEVRNTGPECFDYFTV